MAIMNPVVEILLLVFSIISLYMTFLFMLLYFDNKKRFNFIPKRPKRLPHVSLIVPAYNEEKTIGKTIEALKKLNYPKRLLEIIVVDDGSTDDTYKIAKKFKGIKILRQKNKGKANALNSGLKHAKGKIVGCVDADSCPMPDSLTNSISFFNDETVGAVTTSIFVKNKKKLLERLQWIEYVMIVWSRKLFEFVESIYVTPGPFSLYRKKVLLEVGGFDEDIMTEDIEIAWRLLERGYKIRLAQRAKVLTNTPEYLRKWWKQRIRWNIGGMQTALKYKYTLFKNDFFTLGRIVSPFFIASYIVAIIGLTLLTYLFATWTYQNTLFTTRAYSIGLNPLSNLTFFFIPDIFTFFGLIIFIMSIIWVTLSLNVMGEERPAKSRLKNFFDLMVYLSIYITIFPFNLAYSMLRLAKKRTNGKESDKW